jgi:hypothetical protein
MAMKFRKADPSSVTTYWFGDEAEGDNRDWVRVRDSLSKREANDILKTAPTQDRDLEGAFAFMERFFDKVIVAWSLTDEENTPVEPTVENFREMESGPARQIEDQLTKHFNKMMGREVEQLEGESSS